MYIQIYQQVVIHSFEKKKDWLQGSFKLVAEDSKNRYNLKIMFKREDTAANKLGCGRKKKMLISTAHNLPRTVLKNPNIINKDLRNNLKASGVKVTRNYITRALHRTEL